MTDTLLSAQEEIGAARDYTQNIVRSIAESLIVFGLDGTISLVNRAAVTMLGYSEEELIGQSIKVLMGDEEGLLTSQGVQLLVEKGAIGNVEKDYRTKDGKAIPVLFSCSLMRDKKDKPQAIVSVALDITERKCAEAMLKKSREDAVAASRAKSEFLANMSHEIRTPMNGVLGMIDLLLHSELGQEQKRFADTAYNSGNVLLNLLNDILDLSKIEAGKLELESVDFDLGQELNEVVELFSAPAKAKGLAFGHSLDKSVINMVKGDPVRLRQVLGNLIGNAIKFTDAGEVVVRTMVVKKEADALVVRFEVTDTGVGVSQDAQCRIFDSFTQADTSTTRKHGGTGLGLSISRRLVELMGGSMGVESEQGAGSTFWFTAALQQSPFTVDATECRGGVRQAMQIEAAARSGWQLRQMEQAGGGGLAGKCILLAEDNPVNQQVVIAMLASMECRVDVVKNGKEAVDALSHERYHVVLMDCQMPEMDGYEATRLIRLREKESGEPPVPIVALTAHAMQGDREECLAAGMDDYLTKPFHLGRLHAILSRWAKNGAGPRKGQGEEKDSVGELLSGASRPKTEPIDETVLEALRSLQKKGGPDIVGRIIRAYLTDASKTITSLDDAVQAEDGKEIFRLAHKLKSSCANVGALNLSSLLARAEALGRENKVDETPEVFSKIREEYEAVRNALEAKLPGVEGATSLNAPLMQ
jgi:two-component system, sensor histidine kinase